MSGLVVNKCVCVSCVSLLHTSLYPLLRGIGGGSGGGSTGRGGGGGGGLVCLSLPLSQWCSVYLRVAGTTHKFIDYKHTVAQFPIDD